MKASLLYAGAAAALLLAGVASAQNPPQGQEREPTLPQHPTQPKSDESFTQLDTDGDGRISKSEAEADAKVKQQFSMYDKNGNGYIDKDEVMNSGDSKPEPPKQ